ncbi:MAG: hypothetical protein SWH68_06160 [Thermodesulfobacteriota bacterium]|nr:hypothetical protein [Thermodesulfobacteriota bacterium]
MKNLTAIADHGGPVEIDRKNRIRVTKVQAGVQGRVLGDFVDPFIIMFSAPFAFVGVIWAFVVTATPLNLMSFI